MKTKMDALKVGDEIIDIRKCKKKNVNNVKPTSSFLLMETINYDNYVESMFDDYSLSESLQIQKRKPLKSCDKLDAILDIVLNEGSPILTDGLLNGRLTLADYRPNTVIDLLDSSNNLDNNSGNNLLPIATEDNAPSTKVNSPKLLPNIDSLEELSDSVLSADSNPLSPDSTIPSNGIINNAQTLVDLIDSGKNITIKDFRVNHKYIPPKPVPGQKVLSGAFGSVHILDTYTTVKIAKPCAFTESRNNRDVRDYSVAECKYLREDNPVIILPNINDKKLILAPSLIADGLIGAHLNQLYKYTNHFVVTKGVGYWSGDEDNVKLGLESPMNESYTFMERLTGPGYNALRTESATGQLYDGDIYLALFQLFQGLSVAQSLYKFTHYDLHVGNFMYVDDFNSTSTYNIWNGNKAVNVTIHNPGFTMKIIDFGLSRLETDKTIINNRVDWSEDVNAHNSVFDPYYDMLCVLGSLSSREFSKIINKYVLIVLFSIVLGEHPKSNENPHVWLKRKQREIYPSDHKGGFWWRPKEYTRNNTFIKGVNINTVMYELIRAMKTVDGMRVDIRDATTEEASKMVKPVTFPRREFVKYNVYRPNVLTRFMTNRRPTEFILADGINYYFTELRKMPVYNIKVNLESAINSGYRFYGKCCKIDMIEYMSNRSGFAVTAGYVSHDSKYARRYKMDKKSLFNVKGDDTWKPQLGGFKDYSNSTFVSNKRFDVPNIFNSGTISITDGGKNVEIYQGDGVNMPNVSDDEVRFGVGPILSVNGDNVVPEIYKDIYIYDPILLTIRSDPGGYNLLITFVNSEGDRNFELRDNPKSKKPKAISYEELANYSLDNGTTIVLHSATQILQNGIDGKVYTKSDYSSQMTWRKDEDDASINTFSQELEIERPAPIMFTMSK